MAGILDKIKSFFGGNSAKEIVDKVENEAGELFVKAEVKKDDLLGKAEAAKDELLGKAEVAKDDLLGKAKAEGSELISQIVEAVKPYIDKGEVSERLANAVSGFGDLGAKLKDVLARVQTATGDAAADLGKEKDSLVATILEKGKDVLEAIKENENLPDGIKELAAKAEALLKG